MDFIVDTVKLFTCLLYIVFPEEMGEETGYFLCLGLVTKLYKVCAKQSGDFQLMLQLHFATRSGAAENWALGLK